MEHKNITAINIQSIINYFSGIKFSCELLVQSFEKSAESIDIGNCKMKFIVREFSENIKAIVIDCDNGAMYNITFYGQLSISRTDLENLFGNDRTVYNHHDDLTIHSFNDFTGGCFVSYFTNGRNDESNDQLLNISLNFAI